MHLRLAWTLNLKTHSRDGCDVCGPVHLKYFIHYFDYYKKEEEDEEEEEEAEENLKKINVYRGEKKEKKKERTPASSQRWAPVRR